jgi:hypothetical protein
MRGAGTSFEKPDNSDFHPETVERARAWTGVGHGSGERDSWSFPRTKDGSVGEDVGSGQDGFRLVGEEEVDLLLLRHETPGGAEQVLKIANLMVAFRILTMHEGGRV